MFRTLQNKLATPMLQQKLLINAFLPLVFFVPILKLVVFWPGEDGATILKVVALVSAPLSLFGLWIVYLYLVAKITERERELEEFK